MKKCPYNSNQTSPMSNYCIYEKAANQKMTGILKSTKQLVVKSHDFGSYMTNYSHKMNRNHPFILPDVSICSLRKNNHIMSLTKKASTFTFKDMNRNNYNTTNSSMQNTSTLIVLPTSPNKKSRNNQLIRFNNFFNRMNNKTQHQKNNHNLLIDMLFFDDLYSELSFVESDIFHKENEYDEFIKRHIDNLKNHQTENITNTLSRSYSKNSIKMELQSIKIEFKDIANPLMKPIVYVLPFDYLPLFYYKGIKEFAKFILAMIRWNAPDFIDVTINTDKLQLYLNNFSYNDKPKKSTKVTIQNTINELYNPNTIISNPYMQPKKKTRQSQIKDVYMFIWNTPKSTYQLEIRMPEISMKLDCKKRIIIDTIVNYKMMLYLLKGKFLNWDFYIISYLLSFKHFRYLIENTLSKNPIRVNNKAPTSSEFNGEFQSKKYNDIELFRLGRIYYKNFMDKTSLNKSFYLFFSTDNYNANTFNIVHNHKLNVIFSGFDYHFKFTYNQIRILDIITTHTGLLSIMSKLIILDHSTGNVSFNYSFFDVYNTDDLNFDALVVDDCGQTTKINQVVQSQETNHISKLIPMKLKKMKYNTFSNEIDEQTRQFKDNAINKLISIDMNDWAKYIYSNAFELLNPNNPQFTDNNNPYAFNKGSKKSIIGGLCSNKSASAKKGSVINPNDIIMSNNNSQKNMPRFTIQPK